MTSLAIEFRPFNLRDVVGQHAILQILSNALESNLVPKVMMLDGPSGVGKTTIARIIASCVNCQSGQSIEPCGTCRSCRAISADNHPDVKEIDAASHTSVEDVKDILTDCQYVPLISQARVYIIDEVHMLSNHAFNALLKTFEEPLPHAMFILATTEIAKIPITVLSRCQHFRLAPLNRDDLIKRMTYVLNQKSIDFEDASLRLVAENAYGSMRNALSMLDQVIFYNANKVTLQNVMTVLGITDNKLCFEMVQALVERNKQRAFQLLDEYLKYTDPMSALTCMLKVVHDVVMFMLIERCDYESDSIESNYIRIIADKTTLSQITIKWQILFKSSVEIKSAANAVATLEMAMVKILILSDFPSPVAVLRGLNKENMTQKIQVHEKQCINIKSLGDLLQLLMQSGYTDLHTLIAQNMQIEIIKEQIISLTSSIELPAGIPTSIENALLKITGIKWIVLITLSDKQAMQNNSKDFAKSNNTIDSKTQKESVGNEMLLATKYFKDCSIISEDKN